MAARSQIPNRLSELPAAAAAESAVARVRGVRRCLRHWRGRAARRGNGGSDGVDVRLQRIRAEARRIGLARRTAPCSRACCAVRSGGRALPAAPRSATAASLVLRRRARQLVACSPRSPPGSTRAARRAACAAGSATAPTRPPRAACFTPASLLSSSALARAISNASFMILSAVCRFAYRISRSLGCVAACCWVPSVRYQSTVSSRICTTWSPVMTARVCVARRGGLSRRLGGTGSEHGDARQDSYCNCCAHGTPFYSPNGQMTRGNAVAR